MKDTMSLEEYKAKLDAGVYDYQYKADYEEMVQQYSEVFKLWGQARADADRLRELLKAVIENDDLLPAGEGISGLLIAQIALELTDAESS